MVHAVGAGLLRPLLLLLLLRCNGPSPAATTLRQEVLAQAPDTCSRAVERAWQDFQQGVYTLHSVEFLPQPSLYLHVLREAYQIQWRFVDTDTVGSYYGCYDSLMVRHLQSRYGAAFQQRAARQADSLEQTGRWYRQAAFPEGLDRLHHMVWHQMRWTRLPAQEGHLFASFRIDTVGCMHNVQIRKGLNAAHDQEVVRPLQKLPRWTPAYGTSKPEKKEYTVTIPFFRAIRRQYCHQGPHEAKIDTLEQLVVEVVLRHQLDERHSNGTKA